MQRFISEDPIGFASGDFNWYRYTWNSPTNFIDPYGYNAGTVAGAEIGFGFGGPIGAGIGAAIGTAVVWWGVPAIWDWWNSPDDNVCYAEHTKNKRPSSKAKHQKGQNRKGKDAGGEKGDKKRNYPRKRPNNWKGPWPPKN